MKKALDNFSSQAAGYRKFRPSYPEILYSFLMDHVPSTSCCWDCGTGNGQVAQVLSKYFDHVFATDISAAQLAQAPQRPNITYIKARAELTHFKNETFDLITVAQALHWFDFDTFYNEVGRVAKNGALLAAWGYGLLSIDPQLDPHIHHFYREVVGPYWDSQRRHIDAAYDSIPFPFAPLTVPTDLVITVLWDLDHLKGYFGSWSSVTHYKAGNRDQDPVPGLMKKLSGHWGTAKRKEVRFPLFIKAGKVWK